jgi:hypothetical protein
MALIDYVLFNGEQREQMRATRLALAFAFFLCLSGYKAISEIHFMISGVKTHATANVTRNLHAADNGVQDAVEMTYEFKDQQGQTHQVKESTHQHLVDQVRDDDQTVEIIYLSGSPDSFELTAYRTRFWLYVFGVMVVVVCVWVYIIYANATKDVGSSSKSRKR